MVPRLPSITSSIESGISVIYPELSFAMPIESFSRNHINLGRQNIGGKKLEIDSIPKNRHVAFTLTHRKQSSVCTTSGGTVRWRKSEPLQAA